jgi:hypothetical protein
MVKVFRGAGLKERVRVRVKSKIILLFCRSIKKPPCVDGLRATRDKPTQFPEYVPVNVRARVCLIIKS